MTSRKFFLNYNIIFVLLLLFIISCLSIYEAQKTGQYPTNFVVRQIIWYLVGIGMAVLASLPDEEQLEKIAWYFYGFNLFVLLFLVIAPDSLAPRINDAKSWFVLPGIGSIQPSEFMKISLILVLSKLIKTHNEKFLIRTTRSDMILLCKLGAAILMPITLIMRQPDLGTSLVIFFLLFIMIFVSGISWKVITPIYSSVIVLAVFILYMVMFQAAILEKYLKVKSYQFNRIYAWFDPSSYADSISYNYLQTVRAIGAGQMFGREGAPDPVYVPEKHSDFIFSAIGENFGFLGTSVVVSLFMLLVYNIIIVALKTKEPFSAYVCTGIIAVIVFHVFENIGMCIGILPITGIPLPFISYGGSSLMSNMISMGIILKISSQSSRGFFN